MSFRTFTHADVRHVVIDHLGSGSLSVEGSSNRVVEGSVNADPKLLDATLVRQDGDTLRIEFPRSFLGPDNAHLRLAAPAGLAFTVRSGSATISSGAPLGRTTITSGSGDVDLSATEDLECRTGSGSISVRQLSGSGARLSTGSGDITVAESWCRLNAKSGSGAITVREVRQTEVAASSGSGDIAVPSTTGSVDLRSASGSLTVGVADHLLAWLDLHSVSGQVRIALDATAAPPPGEPYVSIRAHTASGEIAVYRA